MSTEEKLRETSTTNMRVFGVALLQFCLSSVGMMIGNKMAMDYLRDPDTGHAVPSTLVGLQVVGTLFILVHFRDKVDRDKVNWHCIRSWVPIFTLFAGMLYTSAKTFQYVHVSFVIIVRNVGAIVTTVVEYLVRRTTVSQAIIYSEITIVLGTVLYGRESALHFKDFWAGMFWCLLNVLFQTLYGVTVKYSMDANPDIAGMSKYTMSLLNNLLCLPYFVIVAGASGEVGYYKEILPNVSATGWGLVALTCVIGFMISTSGFGLQKLVSATSFLVINNMCKILNILLGIAFLGDTLPNLVSLAGCAVSLGGGFWFSWETHQLNEQKKKEAREAAALAARKDTEVGGVGPDPSVVMREARGAAR
eukprot:TRINITY_DN31552_c0_g1_i1.p1 TRINITY_DN31552_c0_g1~~TRINITY_DN31552_c0_g1_i1.p1  ORF type:complete len:362 (+),score=106.51 TRINITY_DN31552_c0_g1_i1:155-1240(+)